MTGCAHRPPGTIEVASVSEEKPEIKPVTVSEFTLGPGDVIDVTVWRHDELNKKVQVDPFGKISYPLAGEINVSGLSVFTVKDKIMEGLAKYLVDPQVNVSVVSVQSQKVYVLGEVSKPGIFALQAPTNALEAISMAGGVNIDAADKRVLLVRGGLSNPEVTTLNINAALKKGDLTQNPMLKPGDIIYVPAMYIADVGRYFRHLSNILSPIVLLEQGIILAPRVGDVLTGDSQKSGGSTIIIERPP